VVHARSHPNSTRRDEHQAGVDYIIGMCPKVAIHRKCLHKQSPRSLNFSPRIYVEVLALYQNTTKFTLNCCYLMLKDSKAFEEYHE